LVKAVDKDTDVLVLAGDIHTLEGIGEALLHLSATLMPMHIVYVAGNHEYYGAEVTSLNRELRLVFQECPNLHFLEQASIVIDNVVFYGTTLWTGAPVPCIVPESAIPTMTRTSLTQLNKTRARLYLTA